MRLILGILIFVPCAVALSIFAVENRQVLALQFSPLAAKFEFPVAIWLLTFLAVGMIAGLVIGFLSTIIWRRRARKAERLNRMFEGKPENSPEIIPVVPTRAAFSDNGSTREGGQSRLTLTDDR